MKFYLLLAIFVMGGPAPHGAGGLKYQTSEQSYGEAKSRPARGGWIEIDLVCVPWCEYLVPPRTGRVD